ncbi:MAG TPA: helix-turn-helix domain-containing protein [Gemmatimonadaceae bacterium]|nr:helix-turn-helix domain-containing protein [Gemmatimonadaceae bacterium]
MCQDIGDNLVEGVSGWTRDGFWSKAHLREGRPIAELARVHEVHRSWLYKLLARYRREGEAGLLPRSRRPKSSPSAMPAAVAERIVRLRAELGAQGLDAGALTIQWHLARECGISPSVSSIMRLLRRRGRAATR